MICIDNFIVSTNDDHELGQGILKFFKQFI